MVTVSLQTCVLSSGTELTMFLGPWAAARIDPRWICGDPPLPTKISTPARLDAAPNHQLSTGCDTLFSSLRLHCPATCGMGWCNKTLTNANELTLN